MKRRAKIVCTLGPATHSYQAVRGLVDAGMDVARLKFSHAAHSHHAEVYRWVRQASDESGPAVGVLVDLQGPKIRLGTFAAGPVVWATGETVTITTDDVEGTHDRVSTTYQGLAGDVSAGDRLLVDDGRVGLRVVAVDGPDVRLLVTEGGSVSNNKGLSLPGIGVSVPALSEKDEEDLRFALTLRADIVALSFVRNAADIKRCARNHGRNGRAAPGHREDREAAGTRQTRGDRRHLRRTDGRPRRPRRGDASRGGAASAEALRADGARAQQAGHRRDTDARVDDRRLATDAGRGQRRRQPCSAAPTP